jgi:hypothetical protein
MFGRIFGERNSLLRLLLGSFNTREVLVDIEVILEEAVIVRLINKVKASELILDKGCKLSPGSGGGDVLASLTVNEDVIVASLLDDATVVTSVVNTL